MAGQPVKVQEKVFHTTSASSIVATPTSTTTAGNTLLVAGILDATQSAVANGVTDSQGNDSFGVPKNNWNALGGPQNNNGVLIQWYACRAALAITSATVHFSANSNAVAYFFEYSGLNGLGAPQLQTIAQVQNTNGSLKLSECVGVVPPSGAATLLGLFTVTGDTFNTTPLSGSHIDDYSLSTTPNIATLTAYQPSVNTGSVAINGTNQSLLAKSFIGTLALQVQTAKSVTPTNVSQSTLQCSYLILSGGLLLNNQPGFADQPDTILAAENFSLGLELAKINQNAEFGMVRMEFFQGIYKHGDTVDLPTSPVDGYVYQLNELTFIWAVYSSANTSNGWITGPTALWYMGWLVDQNTGAVFSEEWYRNDAQAAVSNDGFLQVFTIAQRQKASLIVNTTPTWSEMSDGLFTTDAPEDTTTLKALNNNAKFAVINTECIYLGEFYNGQNVGAVVSPVDGWAYTEDEVQFIHSWRWTCSQTQYTAPPWDTDWSYDGMYASVAANGAVTCTVNWGGRGGEGSSVSTTDGRIAVFALCQRKPRWVVAPTDRPWDNMGGKNSGDSIIAGASLSFAGLGPNWTTTRIPATAGQTYVLKYISGTITANGVAVTPDGQAGAGNSGIVPGVLGGSGVGCFADSLGNIVGSTFTFSSGSTPLTVPATATHIQLGFNRISTDGTPGGIITAGYDTDAGWTMSITQYAAAVANKFAEIADSIFYPGNTLRANIMQQLFHNTQEASFSPEFFGPTDYGDGATIPVPTSPIDGYVYTRAELTYIWDWKYVITGPQSYPSSSNNNRCAQFTCNVDQATGAVAMSLWRLAPGGPYYNHPTGDSNNATDLITVIVVGFRTQQQTAITAPVTDNAPTDSTTTAGDSSSPTITINGI